MKKALLAGLALGLTLGISNTAMALDDAYYSFGSMSFSGYAAESFGDYVFAVSSSGNIQGWEVSIAAGADANDRDYNSTGTFAPRTFTSLGSISLGGVSNRYASAELYIDNGVMWYGAANTGDLQAFTWDVTAGALTGARDEAQNVTVSNSISSSETLGYDDVTNTWYAGTRGRGIYHLDSSGNWVQDFTYMNMGGDHMDGMEMV